MVECVGRWLVAVKARMSVGCGSVAVEAKAGLSWKMGHGLSDVGAMCTKGSAIPMVSSGKSKS